MLDFSRFFTHESTIGPVVRREDDREDDVVRREDDGSWTLLTGHGHVLVEIARDPTARIRDIAIAAGITERTAQAIVGDLEAAGYLKRERTGRRTSYVLNPDQPFRHQSQDGYVVGPLLSLLTSDVEHASRP